jgi:hypothetical protein
VKANTSGPYIPFPQTLARVAKAAVPVGDYIDAKYQVPGARQAAIDQSGAVIDA